VIYASLLYILTIGLLFMMKPSMILEKDGRLKQFGVGDNCTLTSLGVTVGVIAIACMYTFAVIDVIFNQ
jgi:hypothetical protein